MQKFTTSAIRLYRQIFGTPELAGQLADGIETIMDGNTAVAITEACITEVAALGAEFLDQGAAFAWLSEQQRVNCNLFAEKLSIQQADSPRGALASAIGVSMSGHRSTVFLSAQSISSCQDLLASAVARHLPLVIHLDNRLSSAQGSSPVSGHDALDPAMSSGCIVLFASNIQQAVDYTLIARHVAEISMTPVIVVMDAVETALAIQDVRLPSAELVKSFIGNANDIIESPTVAQKLLFSDQKRRIHCWHDLDKPLLNGALYEPQTYALANAAKETFFDDCIAGNLQNAFSQFSQLTGRHYSSFSSYSLKKADIIFLAQGSAIETLRSMSDLLKAAGKGSDFCSEKINLGVIGLHVLRPFDGKKLLEILQINKSKARNLVVLERHNTPLTDTTPLTREILGILYNQLLNKRNSIETPKVKSVIYGLGGSALNMADCFELLKSIKNKALTGRYLGIPFTSEAFNLSRTKERHPKRQVMIDTLQRYYPQINQLGIYSLKKQLSITAENKLMSFAVSHAVGIDKTIDYAMELSHFLYKISSGFIRSSYQQSWEQWGKRQINTIIQSETILDTGSSALVDYFMLLADDKPSIDGPALLKACESLNHNGVLIFNGKVPLHNRLIEEELILKIISDKNLILYHISNDALDLQNNELIEDNIIQWEKTLATLFAVLLNNSTLNTKTRKLSSIRQSAYEHIAEFSQQQQEKLITIFKDTLNQLIENNETCNISLLLLPHNNSPLNKGEEGTGIVPESVKKLAQISGTVDSLPRFWDQVGVLQKTGHTDQLTADPYLASATIPSLSATFNDMKQHRHNSIPSFDPQYCTACGDCWANCPDSAIASVVISPKSLLETGIKLAKVDSIRPIVSKLATRISKTYRQNETLKSNSREVLNDAFAWFKANASMDAERLNLMAADFAKLVDSIDHLPLIASDLFFYSQENKQNNSGELFSLVINPDSCKACGLCVEQCSQHSLQKDSSKNDNEEISIALSNSQDKLLSIAELKQQWYIWQQTPDTASATIERLLDEKSMDSGSALMLSRYNAFALSGGDHAEPASGEKIAMRQLLSATEYHQQPLLHRFLTELLELREKIKAEINNSLSIALPTDNLTELSKLLSDVKTRQIDLNDLLDKSTQSTHSTHSTMESTAIDAVKTSQLVNLVLQINELHWKLSQGSHGLGRARYSLCITSSSISRWAGTFPYNPFHVPVNIDVSGESAQVAAGLIHGQVNDLLSAISIMRSARASIDARYGKETERLEQLEWDDLTAQEKQLCPPLLLVGGDDLLGSHGFSQVSSMLNSAYPIKIVIFNELDGGLQNTSRSSLLKNRTDSVNNLAMMAMSQRNAYVAQSSIADNSHLQQSMHELLSSSTAGLLCIHTPSPLRHGFDPTESVKQAKLAVQTRMFPLFRYNPEHEGVFGSRLSLAGNSALDNEWALDEQNKVLTPVHWAMNESRFKNYFSVLANSTASAVELQDWLQLTPAEQIKKTPYIVQNGIKNEAQKVTIAKDFASLVIEKQSAWRTLQELSGIVTPFTNYVEQCVAERLSSEHQAELNALKVEYDEKVKQLEENYNAQTHAKIRKQLLGLAGYDASKLSN